MQKTRFLKSLSFIVCAVLIAAMALFAIGCNDNNPPSDGGTTGTTTVDSATTTTVAENNVRGTGAKVFHFTVVGLDGKETAYEIHTDKTVVGEALQELGLIAGEEGAFGLYVKTVDGITVDYDKDGKYWAFYMNGQYAPKGVDQTDITEGTTYTFKAE